MCRGYRKKADRLRALVGLSCLLLAGGCLTGRPVLPPVPGVGAEELGKSLLVLPPLASPGCDTAAVRTVGRELYMEASRRLAGAVVDGAEVASLQPFLSRGNLLADPPVSTSELAAAGRSVDCERVLAVVVREATAVPPLGVSLWAAWIDSESGAMLWNRRLHFRLDDPETSADYARFLETGRTSGGEPDRVAAFLSPHRFQRYVARRTLDAITAGRRDGNLTATN